jgi:hypothetical protein
MRCNLQARGGFHRAKFQEDDSKIIITERALSGEDQLTVREIINVRNFLIASLIIENSCCPAALYALSMTAMKKAHRSPQKTETEVRF